MRGVAVAVGIMFVFMVSVFAGPASAISHLGPAGGLRVDWEILDVDAIPIPVRLTLAGGGLEQFDTYEAIKVQWYVPDAVDSLAAGRFNVLGDVRLDVEFPDFGRYYVRAVYLFNDRLEEQVEETVVVNLDAYEAGQARKGYELLRDASTVFAGVAIALLAAVIVAGFKRKEFFVAVSGILAFAASLWLAPGAWVAIVRLIT